MKNNHKILTSVPHFVGREQELKQIQDFCEDFSTKEKLLAIIGMPGSRKSELLNEGLKSKDRNKIVRPLFLTRDGNKKWSCDDLVNFILKEWSCVVHNLTGDVNFLDVLGNVNKQIILVLEIAQLNFDPGAYFDFWHLLHLVLRKENSIQIIATCCQEPIEVSSELVPAIVLHIRELDYSNSICLLKNMNLHMDNKDCEKIIRCVGGNPFLLRQIGGVIKKFDNYQEDVKMLIKCLQADCVLSEKCLDMSRIKHYRWWSDMINVFDALDETERNVLAKLCVFHGVIPKWALEKVYKEDENIEQKVKHLCDNHCILEKDSNTACYRINKIYHTSIIYYVLNDKELILEHTKSKTKITEFFLNLLSSIAKLFFSKSKTNVYGVGDGYIKNYRQHCKKHLKCDCLNAIIARDAFIEYKTIFVQSLVEGINSHSCWKLSVDVVQFLRNVLSHTELVEIFNNFTINCSDNIDQLVIIANLVFINIYKGMTKIQDKYIYILSHCITELANSDRENVNFLSVHFECLVSCYLKRAYLVGIFKDRFVDAQDDVKMAKDLLNQKKGIACKFAVDGVNAGIYTYLLFFRY